MNGPIALQRKSTLHRYSPSLPPCFIGLEILRNFKFDNDDEWEGGKIYDPESGKTYSCNMSLTGNELKVRGYVGVSLLGRTETWTRTNL